MVTCFTTGIVRLEQHEDDRGLFRVTYGRQVADDLTYTKAAMELGCCIMHQLACDGHLNNLSGEDES